MTDYELEQRLRAWYRDEIGFSEPAPDALSGALPNITDAGAGPLRGWRSVFQAGPRAMAFLVIVLLTILAYGLWLAFAQPRPQPLPLPPPVVTLWIVVQNERMSWVDYSMTGSATSGGSVGGCVVGISYDQMTAPWSVEMDGRTVLTSQQPAAAYAGLPSGGDVIIRIRAPQDGELEVSTVQPGTGVGIDQGAPEACASAVQPAPGVEVPPDFQAPWRTTVAPGSDKEDDFYQVYFLSASAEHYSQGGHGSAEYIQGPIAGLTGDRITFGASPSCPGSGSYQWTMTEAQSTLTFSPIDDSCQARLALFSNPLERYLDMVLLGGVRYVARDFGPPIALTAPPELAGSPEDGPRYDAVSGSPYHYFRIPGLGWEIRNNSNTTPAACNGAEDWLTGGGADNDNYEEPEAIASLDAFRAAFAVWDVAHPDVTVTPPRDLTIAGRPATTVDVVAGTTCATEPGLTAGNVLERDFAVDIGDRVLIIATGPGVYSADEFSEPNTQLEQTYDATLLQIGEAFARSLELL